MNKMENLIAIIKEGKVENLIIASDDFAEKLPQQTVKVGSNEVAIGFTYSDGVFSPPKLSLDEITTIERAWRDIELKATDYLVPITDHPQHAAYMTYRQELRDYPSQQDFPNVERPVKP